MFPCSWSCIYRIVKVYLFISKLSLGFVELGISTLNQMDLIKCDATCQNQGLPANIGFWVKQECGFSFHLIYCLGF